MIAAHPDRLVPRGAAARRCGAGGAEPDGAGPGRAAPARPGARHRAAAPTAAPTAAPAARGRRPPRPRGRGRRSPHSATAAVAPRRSRRRLDGRVQDLKSDVIRLNRDLLVLEEELLFPANTQVALFVSMDVGKMFELDSVQIKLDDKVVTNYLYTPLEVAGAAPRRRAAGLARQPEGRRARARRLLHRQGPARPRLQARRDHEVRQGHRAQVHRAAHQGLDRQAAARVRRQGLAVERCDARSVSSFASR